MKYIMLKNRFEWVDILKGIGIILVVLGHSIEYVKYTYDVNTPFLWSVIDFWLSNFHMALFFILSSFLQRKKELRNCDCYSFKNLKNSILNLIVPYIIFSCFFYFAKFVMIGNVQSTIKLVDLLLIFIKPLSALWFLYLLLIFYVIRVIIYKKNINNLIVLFCTLIMCICSYYISFPTYLEGTILLKFMKFAFYYTLGVEMASLDVLKMNCLFLNHRKKLVVVSLSFLVLGLIVGIMYKNFVFLPIIMILFTIAQIALLIILYINRKSKMLSELGKNSLGIYLIHDYIVCALVIVLKKYNIDSSVLIFLTFVFAILISYYLYLFCLRFDFIRWIFKPISLYNGGKNEYRTKD